MFKRIIFATFLLLLATQIAIAHDTWIEKRNGHLLVLRGHGGETEPYDPALVKEAKGLDAKGQAVELKIVQNKENASLSTQSEPVIVIALYDSGYWLKTSNGWKKATKREGQGKYDIVEALKSKQWCKCYLAECGESSKPVGQQFEIVPQTDPTTLHAGDKLPIKVIYEGKPVQGAVVAVGGGQGSDKDEPLNTDKDGLANVTIAKSGQQLIKATLSVPIKDDPDADQLHVASTITFSAH